MKPMSQIEAWKSVRKGAIPKHRIERPIKGGGYRRRQKHCKQYETEAF